MQGRKMQNKWTAFTWKLFNRFFAP